MRLSLAILLLFAGAPLGAQSIDGVLLTTERNPVFDARIFLVSPRGFAADTARTNMRGEFSLKAAEPGRYALSIRRLGYAPERTPYFTLVADQAKKDTIV